MIGSHNTFTFMRPVQWWARLLTPIAKCQSRLDWQHDFYDLRVRYYKREWWVSHGPCVYLTFAEALWHIALRGGGNVRLLIEGKPTDGELEQLEASMRNIGGADMQFFCGRHKRTWEKLVYGLPDIDVEQHVGSMQSRLIGKLWPWLWTRLHRRQLATEKEIAASSDNYCLFDFL